MEPTVIFEDKSFLAIFKPPGWIVNEAQTTKDQPVFQSWLKQSLDYPLVRSKDYRSGIVHRLDKETSGVLLVAKTKKAFENLQAQFKKRTVEKTYKALVHGKVEIKKGNIKVPIGRLPWNRMRFGVLPGGREAETAYRVENYYKKDGENFTLLKLMPKTGRTHQIRVHLKHLNHPIVSDDFYAGRKTARADKTWCPRLFLHAATISFNQPETQKRITLDSSLPQDLKEALRLLAKSF